MYFSLFTEIIFCRLIFCPSLNCF